MEQIQRISVAICLGTMAFLLVVAIVLRLTNQTRTPSRLKAMSILVICYGCAISLAGFAIYGPYCSGYVLRISRRSSDKLIPLSDPGAIFTLVFNIGLVTALLAAGTYLCIYTWRKAAPKP